MRCLRGHRSDTCRRGLYEMTVSGVNLSESSVKVFRALEVPVLCASLKRSSVASEALHYFRNLEIADQYNTGTQLTVGTS